jgi:hypothetical protein
MQKLFRCLLLTAAAAGFATSADAGELTVKIADGRATVIARDVPLREILAEWARVGGTRMVNSEKLVGGPVSLELVDLPEGEVLDILLRSAAGYMAGPRRPGSTGASMYDRIMILATSRPPANSPGPAQGPQGFPNRQRFQPIPQPPEDDDDGEPEDQGPMPPPGMMPGVMQNPGTPFPGQQPDPDGAPEQGPPGQGPPQTMPVPGQMPPSANPGVNPNLLNQPPGTPPAAPTTAPRPGMLPSQPGPVNPYSPIGRPPGAPPNGPGGGPDDQ